MSDKEKEMISDGEIQNSDETHNIERRDVDQCEKPSKRPWRIDAVKMMILTKSGETKERYVSAIIDSNGEIVCYGNSDDMKFIVSMENSFSDIVDFAKSNVESYSGFLERFGSFSIDR